MKKTRKKKQVCGAACFMAAEIKFSEDIRPWVGVRMITLILFSGFKIFFLHISLGSRSCMGLNISVLIKYAHTGRSCDLLIFGIPEVNFLVRAFQFGMKGVLSRIYDISPGFC